MEVESSPMCFILNGEHGFELVFFYYLVHKSHLCTFGRFQRRPNPILQLRKLSQREAKQVSWHL